MKLGTTDATFLHQHGLDFPDEAGLFHIAFLLPTTEGSKRTLSIVAQKICTALVII